MVQLMRRDLATCAETRLPPSFVPETKTQACADGLKNKLPRVNSLHITFILANNWVTIKLSQIVAFVQLHLHYNASQITRCVKRCLDTWPYRLSILFRLFLCFSSLFLSLFFFIRHFPHLCDSTRVSQSAGRSPPDHLLTSSSGFKFG